MKYDHRAFTKPQFRLEEYFTGKTTARGFFEDRFGKIRREFKVDIEGTWNGEILSLVEDFIYSDGEIEQRIWKIKKLSDKYYEGKTNGVVGKACGELTENIFRWFYTFDMKVKKGTWRVKFDDTLILQDDGTLLNKARVSRFGIHLGTVFLSFRRA